LVNVGRDKNHFGEWLHYTLHMNDHRGYATLVYFSTAMYRRRFSKAERFDALYAEGRKHAPVA